MKILKTLLIISLTLFPSLLLCGCSKKDNTKVSETNVLQEDTNIPYYTLNNTDTQTSGLLDIRNQKNYYYYVKDEYNTYYHSVSSPQSSQKIPGIDNIFSFFENDSSICIFGCDQKGDGYIKIFDHNMNELSSISVDSDSYYTSLCLDTNNNLFTADFDENGHYLKKMSLSGTVIKEININSIAQLCYDNGMIYSIYPTPSGNLAVAVNYYKEGSIYLFNNELEYIGKIKNNSFIASYIFFDDKEHLYIATGVRTGDLYNIFQIDENSIDAEYIKSVPCDYLKDGFGEYDFRINKNNITYGLKVNSDDEEFICDNEDAGLLFLVNDEICYTTSDRKNVLSIYSRDNEDNEEDLYQLDDCGIIKSIRMPDDEHIMFLTDIIDDTYSYVVDLKTGKAEIAQIKVPINQYSSNALVNNDTILVYSYDYANEQDYLIEYGMDGHRLAEIDTKDEFCYYSIFKDNYLLFLKDKSTKSYYCSLLNSKDYSLTKTGISFSNVTDIQPFYRDGKVFLMTDENIFQIEENDGEWTAKPVINFEKTDLPKDSDITDFFYSNDEMYICFDNVLHKLTEK